MSNEFKETALPGCYEIDPAAFDDRRGSFVKPFNAGLFEERGLTAVFREQYYSVSHRNVVRGLHFQVPPLDGVKLVYCLAGAVFDVVVDLRKGSPSFGRHLTFELNENNHKVLYLPSGLAHGFQALSDRAIMVYNTSSEYSAGHDRGVLWNSAGVAWPLERPVISERDSGFPALADFDSPFVYERHEEK